MASMLEKLGAMFEEEAADTTSVSISADVTVSEGSTTEEVVETVDEVQDYVEASDEVEAATQEVEEVTEQMEQTVEAAETAAELRENIAQYGINKQAAALIYQFYGIDKVGSFVTPSVEAIDTVGRNYTAANQLMAALEEAEKGFKARIKAAWNWLIEKLQKFASKIGEFLSPVTSRLSKWFGMVKEWVKSGVKFFIPTKLINLIKGKQLEAVEEKLTNPKVTLTDEEKKNLEAKMNSLKEDIDASTKDSADKQEVAAAEASETGYIGRFLKWCKDKLAAIPAAISKFIQWIKSFFTKKEVAEGEVEEQKKANFISRMWTSFVGAVRSVFSKLFSFFRKKDEAKAEEQK